MIRGRRRREADQAVEEAAEEMDAALADIRATRPRLRQAVDDLVETVQSGRGGDHPHARPHHP